MSARYKFNDFFLALREATNLDIQLEEAALVTRPMHTADSDMLYQNYGLHSGSVQKRDRPIARTFAKSKARGLCHRCGAKWAPRHKCDPGALDGYTRNRLAQDVPAVHILSDFIKNEHEEQVMAADSHTPNGNGIDTKSHVVESTLKEYNAHFAVYRFGLYGYYGYSRI